MRRRIVKISMFAASVVCALAVIANSAAAFKEFVVKPGPSGALGKGGVQKIGINAGTIECEFAKSASGWEGTKTTEMATALTYEKCKAFSLWEASVSEAELVFLASGRVTIRNAVTAKVPALGCEVTMTAATKAVNSELSKVEYANSSPTGKAVTVKAGVEGITYTAGGMCGEGGKNGKYSGEIKSEVGSFKELFCLPQARPVFLYKMQGCAALAKPANTGLWEFENSTQAMEVI